MISIAKPVIQLQNRTARNLSELNFGITQMVMLDNWSFRNFCFSRNLWIEPGFPCGSDSKKSTFSAGDLGSILGSGRPLEKGMATHSSIPAWRIPWTEESGGLQSMGSQRDTEQLSYDMTWTEPFSSISSKPWIWSTNHSGNTNTTIHWKKHIPEHKNI